MADLLLQERLQPSLLDRLTDEDPSITKESRQKRVMSVSTLRDVMLRDLGWLMNATSHPLLKDAKKFPHTSHSVLNFGRPDLTGKTLRDADLDQVESELKQAILDFEPRILASTLTVRISMEKGRHATRNLRFEIEGSLWCQPVPLKLFLKTAVDLESGETEITSLAF
jgi:type VI secretion system protein ImpF